MDKASRREVEEKVSELAARVLEGGPEGLALDRVEFVTEGGTRFLRVFIDHPGGVTLDHCTVVAQELGRVLDEVDPIPESYNLEVSSPGVERSLRRPEDFRRYEGRLATLHFYRAIGGRKSVTGRLAGVGAEGGVVIDLGREGKAEYAPKDISRAHLAVDWSRQGGACDQTGSKDSGSGGSR